MQRVALLLTAIYSHQNVHQFIPALQNTGTWSFRKHDLSLSSTPHTALVLQHLRSMSLFSCTFSCFLSSSCCSSYQDDFKNVQTTLQMSLFPFHEQAHPSTAQQAVPFGTPVVPSALTSCKAVEAEMSYHGNVQPEERHCAQMSSACMLFYDPDHSHANPDCHAAP